MAFRSFRYDANAEDGLKRLLARGDDTFEELKHRIRAVQEDWQPRDDEEEPQFMVAFEGSFLVFTTSEEDDSVLVLAAVHPYPAP